jgi:hypothetical protein
MTRTILCLAVLLVAPAARAEFLLTSVAGGFSDVWSEAPVDFGFADDALGAFWFRQPVNWSTLGVPQRFDDPDTYFGVADLNEFLHRPYGSYDVRLMAEAVYDGWSPITLGITGGQLWQTDSNVSASVAAGNGLNLFGTPYNVTAVVITVDNLAVTQIVRGDWTIDSYSFDFQLDLYGVPEPSALLLLLLCVGIFPMVSGRTLASRSHRT